MVNINNTKKNGWDMKTWTMSACSGSMERTYMCMYSLCFGFSF